MRYYMVDRVLSLHYHEKLTAVKSVALSEDHFADHFFGNPVMPGALQIESLAQAGTVLLEVSSGFTKKALLILVHTAKFRELVRPGDQLRIELEVLSQDQDLVQVEGQIFVDDRLVTSGRLTFSLQPIDKYYPPQVRAVTRAVYDAILQGTKFSGVAPEGRHD